MLYLYINGINGTLKQFFYYCNSQYMKLNKVVDLRLNFENNKPGITRNGEYLRVLSWDLQVFIELNKYIFVVVKSNVSPMLEENPYVGGFGTPLYSS